MKGHQSFILAAFRKPVAELRAIAGDPARLDQAATFHNISADYARFHIGEELQWRASH